VSCGFILPSLEGGVGVGVSHDDLCLGLTPAPDPALKGGEECA
jgi:hypothetical protein